MIHYNSNGLARYKLKYDDEYQEFPRRARMPQADQEIQEEPPRLYEKRLAIRNSKYEHLLSLKHVISSDHHGFYDNQLWCGK